MRSVDSVLLLQISWSQRNQWTFKLIFVFWKLFSLSCSVLLPINRQQFSYARGWHECSAEIIRKLYNNLFTIARYSERFCHLTTLSCTREMTEIWNHSNFDRRFMFICFMAIINTRGRLFSSYDGVVMMNYLRRWIYLFKVKFVSYFWCIRWQLWFWLIWLCIDDIKNKTQSKFVLHNFFSSSLNIIYLSEFWD